VGRLAPTLVVLALLVGTAVAFAVTERLKLERSPLAGVEVDKTFSPVCRCEQRRARIGFRLRRADRVTVEVLDEGGDVVRTLARNRQLAARRTVFFWDGRDDEGRRVSDGVYRPRVRLEGRDRNFRLPNRIRLDTVRPTIVLTDLDVRGSTVRARYRLDEPANAFLLVDGVQRVAGRGTRLEGKLDWHGLILGQRATPGRYRVQLLARDRAGNSDLTRAVAARIRRA
jgi:hypothetical protein